MWHDLPVGFFDSAARALGSLRVLSDAELETEREALRQRYVSGEGDLYDEMHRYDDEMTRRANGTYARENPSPPATRQREHGWYLPNDD